MLFCVDWSTAIFLIALFPAPTTVEAVCFTTAFLAGTIAAAEEAFAAELVFALVTAELAAAELTAEELAAAALAAAELVPAELACEDASLCTDEVALGEEGVLTTDLSPQPANDNEIITAAKAPVSSELSRL